MRDLVADGNSVVFVDHDVEILNAADWMIEMGPTAGAGGGTLVAQGSLAQIQANPKSLIGPFLGGKTKRMREELPREQMFELGTVTMQTGPIHTVRPLSVKIPKGRLTVVTGVSGSGKSTMVLESLVPALQNKMAGKPLPDHVKTIDAPEIKQVKLIDASPIGINVRSTVATYANVHDELRKVFARTENAKTLGWKSSDFSYNTGKLRCPVCDGTGVISLDVQFLPDVEIPCPECHGSRYAADAMKVLHKNKEGEGYSLPQIMAMDVTSALKACDGLKVVSQRLKVLEDLGLGYLTLGEATPLLSGGEAQRLKLASEMGKVQSDSVFVFDEPTIGLHPLDVQTLMRVFQTLIENGATVIVIEHDLDVIRNADWIVDLGPGGGTEGGRIVAQGTPSDIKAVAESQTGRYI
ncbi:MAG: ATP-binding cassette domain-containing protein, partial [Sutterellaceae bacterium]|nr:ATP-binding cassette domain-containing protein [Sutterellaceae bacterium]